MFIPALPKTGIAVLIPILGMIPALIAVCRPPESRRGFVIVAIVLTAAPAMFVGQKLFFERYIVDGSTPEQRQAARHLNFLKAGVTNASVTLKNVPEAQDWAFPAGQTFLIALGGVAPKAIVGASMRRLAHFIYGVINSGKPFDAEIPMKGVAIQDGI